MKTLFLIMMGAWLCAIAPESKAVESNWLEIVFDRTADPTEPYRFFMAANKPGAVTCSLATPLDTYACAKDGEAWYPEQRFLDDYASLDFTMVTIIILGNWLLTWDEGLGATETTCLIEFGTIQEIEFPLVPMISMPPDGTTIINPDPNPPLIAWEYGGVDACIAQPDYVAVTLHGPGILEDSSGEMPCATLSWTPSIPLETGEWTVEVHNEVSSVRLVPDGLSMIGDAWNLDNSDWLSFRGFGISVNEVVPTTSVSFGKAKAIYR